MKEAADPHNELTEYARQQALLALLEEYLAHRITKKEYEEALKKLRPPAKVEE